MTFTTLLSIALGIGLAASAGFRVFLPLFALSLSAYFGLWPVNENWQWLASTPALIILGVATLAEIGAYLVPFIDNLLDTLAVPLAGIAGTAIMASTTADLSPAITWTLAIIAGGGAAAAIKGATATGRAGFGHGNHRVGQPAGGHGAGGAAVFMTLLSLFIPFAAVLLALLLAFWAWRKYRAYQRNKHPVTTV